MSEEERGRSGRWVRRERRQRRERGRLVKHGADVRRVYRDAVLKRFRKATERQGG